MDRDRSLDPGTDSGTSTGIDNCGTLRPTGHDLIPTLTRGRLMLVSELLSLNGLYE